MKRIQRTLMRMAAAAMTLCMAVSAIGPCAAAGSVGDMVIESRIDDIPQNNATYRVWRVAGTDAKTWVEPFDTYKFTMNYESESEMSTLAATLAAIVIRDDIKETASGATGEDGQLHLSGLTAGVYLITGTNRIVNSKEYRPKPTLVMLESSDGVKVEMKHDYIKPPKPEDPPTPPRPDTVTRKVLKVWEGDRASTRPETITVELLRNGKVYDTQVLSSDNQWRYTWTSLPVGYDWVITEVDVPSDYRVTVDQTGITTVITNTLEDEPEPPDTPTPTPPPTNIVTPPPVTPPGDTTPPPTDVVTPPDVPTPTPTDPNLPQTGTTWWVVHLLAGAGVTMIVVGSILGRNKKKQ